MKIIQILSTIAYGDAVSNDVIAFRDIICSMGYETSIYAESIVYPLDGKTAENIENMPELQCDDIVIYHLSTGTDLSFKFADYRCRKVLVYHNITPPKFFEKNDEKFKEICEYGLLGVKYLADKVDYVLAVSEFNKQDLISMGYKCPIDVLPIIIPMKDYEKKPDRYLKRKLTDGMTNILFTGRIAPNKKHEDVLAAFYYYNRIYNYKSRLILAGSYKENDPYYLRLLVYAKRLGLEDSVIFTGHIKFKEIISCYKTADAFLCLSEHEGFCVPLVEAMIYEVPIIAYDSCAISSTLGGSGMLIDSKDPVFIAGCMDRMIRDGELRNKVILAEKERLKDFEYNNISQMFKNYLGRFISEKDMK